LPKDTTSEGNRKAANTNIKSYGLTRSRNWVQVYRLRNERSNHYATHRYVTSSHLSTLFKKIRCSVSYWLRRKTWASMLWNILHKARLYIARVHATAVYSEEWT